MKTNVDEFISELGAGVLKEKLAAALSEVALGAVINGGPVKGKLSLDLTISQMGDNSQVIISHRITTSVPTRRGKRTEEDTTETAMFVGRGGAMTIAPPKEELSGQFNLTPVED